MCNEYYDKLKILNINCPKCLDTKMLWKNRNNNIDGKGYFMIVSCNQCDNNHFIDYSLTSNIMYCSVPIFPYDNDSYIVRIPTVRKLYDYFIMKNKQ
jgi:ribosomal protein S27E